jgi:hypothetical protein
LYIVERRIKTAWPITDQHRLATILHPKMKHFENFPDQKDQSITALEVEVEKYSKSDLYCDPNSPLSIGGKLEVLSTVPKTTMAKKKNNLLLQCFDLTIDQTSKSTNPRTEIDEYLAGNLFHYSTAGVDGADDLDVLLFWKEKKHAYPTLSSIARDVFAIPASNTTIERLFSSSKNMMNEKQTLLASEKINQLLFLQKNFNNLKKLKSINKRKRTLSASSSTTSSSDFGCSISKKRRVDDSDFSDSDDIEFLAQPGSELST